MHVVELSTSQKLVQEASAGRICAPGPVSYPRGITEQDHPGYLVLKYSRDLSYAPGVDFFVRAAVAEKVWHNRSISTSNHQGRS